MKQKRQVNTYWLLKMALCFEFSAFCAAKCEAQLGGPPSISVQPLGVSVQSGGTALIATTAVSLTPMTFTWKFKGNAMTNPQVANVNGVVGVVSTLTIPDATSANAGDYSVTIVNGVGTTTSSNANLVVLLDVPATLSIVTSSLGLTTNGFNLQLSGPSGSNYVIEASTDLQSWKPISTNAAPNGTVSYTDTAATNFPARFYRAMLQ